MASFLCEMADVIICVKYAPNKTVQEIEFQQGWKNPRFVPSDGLSADTVHVPLLALDQICFSPVSSFWFCYLQSEKRIVM